MDAVCDATAVASGNQMTLRGLAGLLLLIVLGLAGFAGAAPEANATTTGGTRYTHVVWVVMENHSYSQIIGSSSAPYINSLAKTYGNATQMFAETHPSLPNYIAMTSGGTQGITDDNGPNSHRLGVASIFSELGTNSRSLEESMPSNCAKSSSGNYAVKHNPEAYYTNLNGSCATNDVPLGTTPNISAEFTFITPNLCDDMHNCSVANGDTWLKGFVPKLLATSQYTSGTTVIFLTWDEDNDSSGNHIPTIVISPTTKAVVSSTKFTHYSMLRTTEELLGLPRLGAAQTANDMLSSFKLG
jgi:hypothetical protein